MKVSPLLLVLVASGCDTHHVLGELDPGVGGCGPFVAGNDLAVCTATYLNGQGSDVHPAIDLGADNALLITTSAQATDFPGVTHRFADRGAAVLMRMRTDGRQIASVTHLGDNVTDLEVDRRGGDIVVGGTPFGIARLSPDATQIRWTRAVGAGRVAIGVDGTVAALDLDQNLVTLWSRTGVRSGSFPVSDDGLVTADVAVDGNVHLVMVTGSTAAGAARQPVLYAFRYDGSLAWKNWGWREADLLPRKLSASTRGLRVTVGRDGQLYYLGDSHGGNTSHGKDPRNLELDEPQILSKDAFNLPYNTSATVTFYARLRARDGIILAAQYLLTRTTQDRGESVEAEAIAADELGNVMVGGSSRCCLQDQDKKRIGGTPTVAADMDDFVLIASADFQKRLLWTTFGRGGSANTTGVVMARGIAAQVAFQASGAATGPLITVNALSASPGGGSSERYLAVWSAP